MHDEVRKCTQSTSYTSRQFGPRGASPARRVTYEVMGSGYSSKFEVRELHLQRGSLNFSVGPQP